MARLTEKERTVLFLIALGESYEHIAKSQGWTSTGSVANILTKIIRKLCARGKENAIAIAIVAGEFTEEELAQIKVPPAPHAVGIEMLGLVARGRSNVEIAAELGYSIDTVIQYLGRVIKELGETTSAGAIATARWLGYLAKA